MSKIRKIRELRDQYPQFSVERELLTCLANMLASFPPSESRDFENMANQIAMVYTSYPKEIEELIKDFD